MEQATPYLAAVGTTVGAAGTEAVAAEAGVLSAAPAVAVASAGWAGSLALALATSVALALAPTTEVAMKDAHPLRLDIRSRQF